MASSFNNDLLVNMIKQHASSQMMSYSYARIGWVKDFNPEDYTVKVGYFNIDTKDWDLMSGWLPILSPTLGKGDDSEGEGGDLWGFCHVPNINEQVIVVSFSGEFTNAFVLGALYSTKVPPPKPDGELTQMGEFLWCHKTGSYLKFLNNGDVTLVTDHDLNVHVKHDGKVLIEGNLTLEVHGNAQTFVHGNADLVVNGHSDVWASSMTAAISGNLTANATGGINLVSPANVDISAAGSLNLNNNGPLNIRSHTGIVTIDSLAGIFLNAHAGPIIMTSALPILANTTVVSQGGAATPPLPPIIIPPLPGKPAEPELFGEGGGAPGPTPTPTPGPPEVPGLAQGGAPGVGGLNASNPQPGSVDLQWGAPQ